MLIRSPRPADAADLGRLHAAAWQAAYRDTMPEAYLATITAERRTRMWESVTAMPSPGGRISVAEVDGVVVGFVWTGACRDQGADAIPGAGEVIAINVAPESWGTGAGRALLAAGHEALVADGFEVAMLWVVAGNERARRFYERNGWAPDGAAQEDVVDGGTVSEVRYVRRFGGGDGDGGRGGGAGAGV